MSEFNHFTKLVASLPANVPFVGPETIERQRGLKVKARIGANENGFGPAPSVQKAIADAASTAWKYGDTDHYELKAALSAYLGTPADTIAIGEGVDGLLGLIVRMVMESGAKVVTSLGAYPTFNYHVHGFGGQLVTVPYRDDREDLDALLSAVKREKPSIVYFANPDNPMASWYDADDVIAFAKAVPESTLLVLDEAYCELGPASALPSIESLIDRPNIVRTRTFSKAYGLAGMRVGYTISTPGFALAFNKVRNHFGVSRLSSVAALAAVKDTDYLQEVIGKIAASRDRINGIARANGLEPLPSATNFVTIDCGRDGDYSRAIVDKLMERGVFIRMPGVAPLNRCIRISAGPEPDMALLEATLPDVLKEIG